MEGLKTGLPRFRAVSFYLRPLFNIFSRHLAWRQMPTACLRSISCLTLVSFKPLATNVEAVTSDTTMSHSFAWPTCPRACLCRSLRKRHFLSLAAWASFAALSFFPMHTRWLRQAGTGSRGGEVFECVYSEWKLVYNEPEHGLDVGQIMVNSENDYISVYAPHAASISANVPTAVL